MLCSLLALATVGAALPAKAEGPRPIPARERFVLRRAQVGLSVEERAALLAGETISRPLRVERASGRYVGGVAYQVVRASPAAVLAALGSPAELPAMLPRTKEARLVAVGARGARIELTQGTALVDATYTVKLRRAGPDELRFALDPTRPHGIRDVYGYVRARPLGKDRTLLTVAVLLDVGPGLVRALFEDRIQRVVLSTPRQIRDYLEPKAVARRGN